MLWAEWGSGRTLAVAAAWGGMGTSGGMSGYCGTQNCPVVSYFVNVGTIDTAISDGASICTESKYCSMIMVGH